MFLNLQGMISVLLTTAGIGELHYIKGATTWYSILCISVMEPWCFIMEQFYILLQAEEGFWKVEKYWKRLRVLELQEAYWRYRSVF